MNKMAQHPNELTNRYTCTVCQEIFCVALFSWISWISLSCEIKFRESVAMSHLLWCPHVSFTKIFFTNCHFHENFPVYGIEYCNIELVFCTALLLINALAAINLTTNFPNITIIFSYSTVILDWRMNRLLQHNFLHLLFVSLLSNIRHHHINQSHITLTLINVRYSAMAVLAGWLSFLAWESQTQQWTPLRPLYTHKQWENPKSS